MPGAETGATSSSGASPELPWEPFLRFQPHGWAGGPRSGRKTRNKTRVQSSVHILKKEPGKGGAAPLPWGRREQGGQGLVMTLVKGHSHLIQVFL